MEPERDCDYAPIPSVKVAYGFASLGSQLVREVSYSLSWSPRHTDSADSFLSRCICPPTSAKNAAVHPWRHLPPSLRLARLIEQITSYMPSDWSSPNTADRIQFRDSAHREKGRDRP